MPTIFDSCEANCVSDALGLGSIADADGGVDPELLRALFRHARGEDGTRVMFENDPTFTRGWLRLDSPRAAELVSAFVALDDADNVKQARKIAQANIEAQAWNDLLGIEQPPIRCRVKIHGSKWGLRFESAQGTLKGKELVNEQLPPIPIITDPNPAATASNPVAGAPATQTPPPTDSAENALRAGGFPV